MAAQARPQNNGLLPNGAPQLNPVPGAIPLLPNQGRIVQTGSQRILCVADVRGNLSSLNDLAAQARADYVLHTGDFGFYDQLSLDRIAEKTLKHVAQYSPLITEDVRRQITSPSHGGSGSIKDRIPRSSLPLSQLPQFLSGALSFKVPIYTVWGACEDVQVLEKLRSGEYKINNLHIIDESHSRLLEIGGIKLRLLGLGGALVMHKLFDNGEGRTTIAGGQGTMWTTLLQMGELVDTANRVYDPTETRVLVTHASPARDGLLNQLSVALKVDFSISAGLHFRYGSSYNEFSVNPTLDHYRGKLAASKASFNDVWETVKAEVQPAVQENEAQKRLLDNALEIVGRMPSVANGGNPFGGHVGPNSGQVDEAAFKNMWNFNLADAAFGWLVLEIENGRIGTEMRAQGFNFAHRGQKNPVLQADMVKPSGPTAAAAPAQPSAAPQNVQAPRGAAPTATVPSPAAGQQGRQVSGTRPTQPAHGAAQQQQQQQTPQTAKSPAAGGRPGASPSNAKAAGGPAGPTANGSANGGPNLADEGSKDSPVAEKKPSQAIFVQNVSSEDEVRSMVQEQDRSKIQRIERSGRAFVVHFSSPEEMQQVLGDVSSEFKKSGQGKPNMREYQDRGRSNWGVSGRGGQQGGGGGGYRSGGASDSEGGRGGRGSFRGPRGGRGDRGRGGRGGRGAFRGDIGSSPAASPAPPAAS